MKDLVSRCRAAMNLILAASAVVLWANWSSTDTILPIEERIWVSAIELFPGGWMHEALDEIGEVVELPDTSALDAAVKKIVYRGAVVEGYLPVPDPRNFRQISLADFKVVQSWLSSAIPTIRALDEGFYAWGDIPESERKIVEEILGDTELFYPDFLLRYFPEVKEAENFSEVLTWIHKQLRALESLGDASGLEDDATLDDLRAIRPTADLPLLGAVDLDNAIIPFTAASAAILLYIWSVCATMTFVIRSDDFEGNSGRDWLFFHSGPVGPTLGILWLLAPSIVVAITWAYQGTGPSRVVDLFKASEPVLFENLSRNGEPGNIEWSSALLFTLGVAVAARALWVRRLLNEASRRYPASKVDQGSRDTAEKDQQ